MILSYKLEERDFLTHQLFIASKSDRIRKKQKRDWLFLTFGSILLALYFFYTEVIAMTIHFTVLAFVFGVFYKKYFLWRYKSYYLAYVKEIYGNRIGVETEVEITDEFILIKDKTGEAKVRIEEVEEINNLGDYILAKISTGVSLVIPKSEIDNSEGVLAKFESMGIRINDETNWKWG